MQVTYQSINGHSKTIKFWPLDNLISDSLPISNTFLFVILCCWIWWLPTHQVLSTTCWRKQIADMPCLGTLTYHPGNPPLTLGISSGGQHGNCPTHSHLSGVDCSMLCHGPGAQSGWQKEALSVKSPTACTVWGTRSLKHSLPVMESNSSCKCTA